MGLRSIVGKSALTGVLLAAAFTAGVSYPDFRTAHDGPSFGLALQRVPERLQSALFTAAHGEDAAQTPADVYADVLTTLQNNYFGLKDYAGKYGGTGITLDTNRSDQVFVESVGPNTPAASAGVKTGDIIVAVDNQPTDKSAEIDINTLLWGEPNTKATVTVLRSGARQQITLTRALLPREIDATQMTYNGIRGMMGSLKDRYTRFLDPPAYADMMSDEMHGEFVGIGAMLGTNKQNQVYVVKVLANGPAHAR